MDERRSALSYLLCPCLAFWKSSAFRRQKSEIGADQSFADEGSRGNCLYLLSSLQSLQRGFALAEISFERTSVIIEIRLIEDGWGSLECRDGNRKFGWILLAFTEAFKRTPKIVLRLGPLQRHPLARPLIERLAKSGDSVLQVFGVPLALAQGGHLTGHLTTTRLGICLIAGSFQAHLLISILEPVTP